MNKCSQKHFRIAGGLLGGFALWTAAVCRIDVQPIGPRSSAVGLAALNRLIHGVTGVHMSLYAVTDWLGLVPMLFGLGFALLGLVQWVSRKSIRKVDWSLLVLGTFYMAVMAAYVFFEMYIINLRPVLIEGALEASYPSSTTLLTLCVMSTAALQLRSRIKGRVFRNAAISAIVVFTVFMVLGRLVSGVHWFTDIVGGILLSAGLVMMYRAVCDLK